eukprot:8913152-Pyramimonas_sp.AAC.1
MHVGRRAITHVDGAVGGAPVGATTRVRGVPEWAERRMLSSALGHDPRDGCAEVGGANVRGGQPNFMFALAASPYMCTHTTPPLRTKVVLPTAEPSGWGSGRPAPL